MINRTADNKIRLFKSDFWESLTRVSPYSPFIFWSIVIGVILYRSVAVHGLTLVEYSSLFTVAVVTWTFLEYWIHRVPFHFQAKSEFGKKVVFILHGCHHEDAHDRTRSLMPIAPAVIYGSMLFGFYCLLLGMRLGESFFAFFMLSYLAYDYLHFYIHIGKPKSKIVKYLRKIHLIHHVHDNAYFGVTSPFWDYVFGTTLSSEKRSEEESLKGP